MPKPKRRLKGWRWKGKKEAVMGIPPRDISLQEALQNDKWYSILKDRRYSKYYKPEYTKPDRGEH